MYVDGVSVNSVLSLGHRPCFGCKLQKTTKKSTDFVINLYPPINHLICFPLSPLSGLSVVKCVPFCVFFYIPCKSQSLDINLDYWERVD